MIMTKEFISEKETIIEALDDIQGFLNKMEMFMEKYPSYEYDIKIDRISNTRSNKNWVVQLKVIKDEKPENIKVS